MAVARQLSAGLAQDPSSFPALAERLGVRLRKAYYLAQIGRQFEGLPIADDEVEGIGWTKLQLIPPHIDRSNCLDLIAKAKAHPVHVLRAVLQGMPHEEGKHAVLFYLTDEEFDLLARVVEAHGGRRINKSLRDKEEALVKALKRLV